MISPKPKTFALIAAAAVCLVGVVVLLGWAFEVAAIESLGPGWPKKRWQEAVLFLSGGLITFICMRLHRARQRTETIVAELQQESAKRQEADERAHWLASFPERNPNPIAEFDPQSGTLLYANPAATALVPGLAGDGLDHPGLASAREIVRGWNGAHPDVARCEATLAGACYLLTVTCDPQSRRARIYGSDITERKRAEDALRESEELFAKSFRLSPDCVAIVRAADRTVIQANDALCALWGATPAEVIGKPTPEYARWLHEEERLAFMQTLEATGECLNYETKFQLGGERRVDFNISSRMITFQGESCILGVMRDVTERRRIEATAARLAAIVESSVDAIIGMDVSGIITSWNGGAEKIFGYTVQEIVGQSIMRLIPPERAGEEEDILSRIRRGESIPPLDTVRRLKDGRSIDIAVTVSAIKNHTGQIVGASKVARDITARKQAEAALRETQTRLNSTLAAGLIGTWSWDLPNDHLMADEFTARSFSLDPAIAAHGLPAREYLKAVFDEDQPAVSAALAQAISACGHYDIQYRVHRKDGGLCWLQARGRVEADDAGKAAYFHGAVMDITDRKLAETAMRDSEERFRSMANSMSQLAWIARPDGFIFWYNERWYEYTGTTPAGMEGWGWQSVHHPDVLPKVIEQWKEAIDTGEPFEMEFPLRGKGGQFRRFLTRGHPLKNADGRVMQWFGTNTDVEVLKDAEEKIREMNSVLEQRVKERTAQLESANKELEAFSYSVSHDLRAPLRAVDGYSQAVLEDYGSQLPEEGRRYLQTIRGGAQKMGVLIDDLLTFSRLSRAPLKKQEVNTRELVRSVIEDLQFQLEGRQTDLRVGELPTCDGDPALLRQIWINLLSNAFKYSRKREVAVVEVGCEAGTSGDVYFIRDNGTGFDMRYADKLFGVFQRLHRAEDYEGTGVGLAIVQRIIHRHGGRIWAEAEEGCGATFYFTLAEKTKP